MTKGMRNTWWLVLVALLLCSSVAMAQTTTTMTILRVVPQGKGPSGGLLLDIYFTLRDSENRPMPNANFGAGTVSFANTTIPPVATSSVKVATSSSRVALLIDASGSMMNLMPDVQKAAIAAVKEAPANTGIAVFAFSDTNTTELFRPLSMGSSAGFNTDMQLVASDIQRVEAVKNGSTCLYDASFLALEYVRRYSRVEEGERAAVIIFTDGRDEKFQSSGTCSKRSLEDVVRQAKNGPLIPIHTIGFCTQGACENIDKVTLQTMSWQSGGFSVDGQQNELDAMFKDVMLALKSQWVVQVEVFVGPGEHHSTLSLPIQGEATLVTAPFSFTTTEDYQSVPSFKFDRTYDPDLDVYMALPNLTNPQTIKTVRLLVKDKRAGTTQHTAEHSGAEVTEPFEVPGTLLEANREYCFQIEAIDAIGANVLTPQGDTVLGEMCGIYEPKLAWTIDSYRLDPEFNYVDVNFDVRGAGKRTLQIDGQISDEKSGEIILEVPRTVLEENQKNLRVDLPDRFRELADGQRTFRVALRLIPGNDQPVEPLRVQSFKPDAAPRSSGWSVFFRPFTLPYVQLALVAIVIIAGVALFFIRRSSRREETFVDPRQTFSPQTAPLNERNPTPSAQSVASAAPIMSIPSGDVPTERLDEHMLGKPSLVVRVLNTVDQTQIRSQHITRFPCMVGRSAAKTQFYIGGDPDVSREHLRLDFDGQSFSLYCLSRYGVSVDGTPLPSHTTMRITNKMMVGLSPRTIIEIERIPPETT